MKIYKNLTLVGTTHLTPKEVIIDIIKKENPDKKLLVFLGVGHIKSIEAKLE